METLPPELIQLILGYADDMTLAKACMVNRRMAYRVCNNTLWVNKIVNNFNLDMEQINKYKGENSYAAYYFYLSEIFSYENFADDDDVLIYGSTIGRPDLVIIALQRGADVRVDDDISIMLAIRGNYYDIVKILLDYGAKNGTALIIAANEGYADIVKLLLDYGANVHAENEGALVNAVTKGYNDIVRMLLENGANPHIHQGYILSVADWSGNSDLINILNEYL